MTDTFPTAEAKELIDRLAQESMFFVTEATLDDISVTVLCMFTSEEDAYLPIAVMATPDLVERLTPDDADPMPYSVVQPDDDGGR